MGNAIQMIFTKEEINRIKEKIKANGEREVSVDLHHLTVKEAQKFMKNLIALDREGCTMRVIHGYNHGTAIKTMIQNNLQSQKIAEKHSCAHNPGQTILTIKKAA